MTARRLPDVVATISAGNGMGKTLAANYLVHEYGYTKLSFAQPLKDMLETLYCSMGFTSGEAADMVYGTGKELPVPGLAMDCLPTPRTMMISLGTGWGRNMVYSELWVDVMRARIKVLLAQGGRVVIDDTRFRNEMQMLDDVTDGLVQFTELRREVAMDPAKQVGDLDVKAAANVIVYNDGTPSELYSRLDVTLFNYEEHFGL